MEPPRVKQPALINNDDIFNTSSNPTAKVNIHHEVRIHQKHTRNNNPIPVSQDPQTPVEPLCWSPHTHVQVLNYISQAALNAIKNTALYAHPYFTLLHLNQTEQNVTHVCNAVVHPKA